MSRFGFSFDVPRSRPGAWILFSAFRIWPHWLDSVTRRGQAELPLRIVPIRDFAKALRQGAARATLLGDRRPKPRHDVGTEPPLQLFHDKPSLQNHLLKTGMRGM